MDFSLHTFMRITEGIGFDIGYDDITATGCLGGQARGHGQE